MRRGVGRSRGVGGGAGSPPSFYPPKRIFPPRNNARMEQELFEARSRVANARPSKITQRGTLKGFAIMIPIRLLVGFSHVLGCRRLLSSWPSADVALLLRAPVSASFSPTFLAACMCAPVLVLRRDFLYSFRVLSVHYIYPHIGQSGVEFQNKAFYYISIVIIRTES